MNKFGNKPAAALNISFKSGRERDHALWLESEKQAGRITEWKYEPTFRLLAYNGHLAADYNEKAVEIGTHKPDFLVQFKDGHVEVHEVKGGKATKTEAWYLRWRIVKANYPHITFKVFDGIPRIRGGRVIQFD